MTDNNGHAPILGERPPLSYRLFNFLERRNWMQFLRSDVAHSAFSRRANDWEWIMQHPENKCIEIHFVAPRIPTRITLTLSGFPAAQKVVVNVWKESDWAPESCQATWDSEGDRARLRIRLDRLCVTRRLKIELFGAEGLSFHVIPFVARHRYVDVQHLGAGVLHIENSELDAAKQELQECLSIEPHHFLASAHLAKLAIDEERWTDAIRWSVHSNIHSRGDYSEQIMWEAFQKSRGALDQIVPALRRDSKEWDVGGHYGSVCLLNDVSYWLGFGRFHLMQRHQIVDVRRSASARLLRHLFFDYIQGKEQVAYAGLRVWRGDDDVIDVPLDHLAMVDHADHNPAIRLEGRKRGLFHLPELKRGDALELVYALIHVHPERANGHPDFFILSDLSTQFPTWTSRTTMHTPASWNVRCVSTNGAPPPEVIDELPDYRSHRVEMSRIVYDEWGLTESERLYRSPHVCCSWGDRAWSDVAEEGSTQFCHILRDDTLPTPIQTAVNSQDSVEDKLRAGFEWIRDNLKYMSLKANKVRTDDPELARKIVADGVGDCMDRAYLVALLCRQLGIDAEYVVTAAESEYVVPDIPSQQFDHILVRARLNGGELYLDATSSETPFRWIPRYLQGLPVLPLRRSATLEIVPEESPDVNQVAIVEQLTCANDGTLTGEFEMTASGVPGRWWDSQWKATTMDVDNPLRVARVALRRQLPNAVIEDWDIRPYDLTDERFVLFGRHTRRPLFAVDHRLYGTVDWRTELFQMYEHKDRAWDGVSIFPLPLHYTIALTVAAPDGYTIEGTSSLVPFTSEFGDVTMTVACEQAVLTLRCLLRVKRKFVVPQSDDDVLAFLDAWQRALTFAFVLKPL